MAKSVLEKELEKQRKANERASREARNRIIADSIIGSQPIVYGVRIMDPDSEAMLEAILNQYDGNVNNQVAFNATGISRSLEDSIAVQYEKLKMYGIIAAVMSYSGGAIITLSDTAKTYKSRKEAALQKEREEKIRKEKLETDYLKIQGMSLEQLREIYLQALLTNEKLQKSVEVNEKQLQVLKNIFENNEDSVAIQEEIMQKLIEREKENHPIRDYLADKGGDLGVEALTKVVPTVWLGIKAWLAANGITT